MKTSGTLVTIEMVVVIWAMVEAAEAGQVIQQQSGELSAIVAEKAIFTGGTRQ